MPSTIPRPRVFVVLLVSLAAAVPAAARAQAPAARPAPKILIDQPPVAVQYQLNRLSADDLVRLERRPNDPKYRLVYLALLSRRGIEPAVRDEALRVLVAMDRHSALQVLLDALAVVPDGDDLAGDRLLAAVAAQPRAALAAERAGLARDAGQPAPVWRVRGIFAALFRADAAVSGALQLASSARRTSEAVYAFRTLPQDADGRAARDQAFSYLRGRLDEALAGTAALDASLAEPVEAVGWTTRDAAAFHLLAGVVLRHAAADASVTAAAIRALNRLPREAWPPDEVEPLARAVVADVSSMPPSRRAEAAALDGMQLGESLAAALPDPGRAALRRDLRGLGVRLVRLQTIVEQMSYDRAWFAVEAGKPVQIVFTNREAMPHNVVVGTPGSLEAIGNAGAAVPLPTDAAAKPYVPTLPSVLAATTLLKEGETARLTLTVPSTPGEYVFLCTFPGHWVRMYGVMLVVPDLAAWESAPTTPTDPITRKPFAGEMR